MVLHLLGDLHGCQGLSQSPALSGDLELFHLQAALLQKSARGRYGYTHDVNAAFREAAIAYRAERDKREVSETKSLCVKSGRQRMATTMGWRGARSRRLMSSLRVPN